MDKLICLEIYIYIFMCSKLSKASMILASMPSLLPNSLLFFQLAVPSFKKSLYSSQSKLDQWCLPYLYDNRISIFEASGGGGDDLVVPNLPALLVLTVSSNFFRNSSIFVSSLLTRYFDIPTYVMSSAYFGVIRKYFICFDWFDKKFCKVEHKQYCTETITLYNCCISFETLPDGFFYLHFNFRLVCWYTQKVEFISLQYIIKFLKQGFSINYVKFL